MKQIDIADLDCIYLTYDEPQKEEFWVRIQNMIPWARRVDGVQGSDAAHKAAAEASATERFILIDGDNIPDADFFNLTLAFADDSWEQAVFRWRARNHVNGLRYGNGGLSSWTREFVRQMRTHENSDGSAQTQVEFCYEPNYWAMHDCYSTTYPNATPQQAWRAGFREGVKMCLNMGAKPTISEFRELVHKRNLDNLTVWHNIGADAANGYWCMAGARQGTYMTMLTDWDHTQVQSFDALAEIWHTVERSEPRILAGRLAEDLGAQLALPMLVMEGENSAFFKQHLYKDWQNLGVMTREIDVIRRQEGW